MKKERWIVIANKSEARIFRIEKGLNPVEIETFVHSESRLKALDLVGDRPGRSFESNGQGRHAYQQPTMPKQHEAEIFAKQVGEYIELARSQDKLERLYIAAGPSFLGLLRQHLSPLTEKIIFETVDKDITHLKPSEIIEYFPIGI